MYQEMLRATGRLEVRSDLLSSCFVWPFSDRANFEVVNSTRLKKVPDIF
jgi:hypothetical protein